MHAMLESLRKWGQKLFPSDSPESERQSAENSRDRRAQTVSNLQEEIHRIQFEISDLNDAMNASPATEAQQSRMAVLHRELAMNQQELKKYQARI